ncbi:hypothetical protein [Streptococcus pluranimalium]
MNWLERKDTYDNRLTIQDREIVAYLDQNLDKIQQMTSQSWQMLVLSLAHRFLAYLKNWKLPILRL